MQIQLSIFLYIYLVFLLAWLAFSFTALYHIFKFGFKNFISYFSAILYIIISVIMLGASFFYIIQVDWSVDIFSIDNSSSAIATWE